MAKTLAEFKFRRLGIHFMESSDYYKTTGGVKHMGTQNR
jgi:hypothetical protein